MSENVCPWCGPTDPEGTSAICERHTAELAARIAARRKERAHAANPVAAPVVADA